MGHTAHYTTFNRTTRVVPVCIWASLCVRVPTREREIHVRQKGRPTFLVMMSLLCMPPPPPPLHTMHSLATAVFPTAPGGWLLERGTEFPAKSLPSQVDVFKRSHGRY